MQPRLKSSKKWTAFPAEYLGQIQKVFQENFAAQLTDGTLVVEGRIYPEEITLRVGIRKNGELRQRNFEVSMDHSAQEQDAIERIHNCVDAAASMMMDFFESEDEVDFPLAWKPFPLNDKTVYLQSSSENSELEAEADRLLGLADEGLVHESADDPEDDGQPRMFGSPKAAKSTKKKLH